MGNSCSYCYYHYCCCDECCECSPEDCFEEQYKRDKGDNTHLKQGNITYRFLSDPYHHP